METSILKSNWSEFVLVSCNQALNTGLVSYSRICTDRESLVKDAIELAGQISKKSPVAMSGIKHNLNYSRDHSAKEGLEYMVSMGSVASPVFRHPGEIIDCEQSFYFPQIQIIMREWK